MDIVESLQSAWEGRDPYPGLSILEAAIIWYEEHPGEWMPAMMYRDIVTIFGEETVQKEQNTLETAGAFLSSQDKIMLNGDFNRPLSSLINEMKSAMLLPVAGGTLSAEDFLKKLSEYLFREAGVVIEDTSNAGKYSLIWNDERYDLRLGLSPVWLPALADKAAEKRKFVAAFGPFAALSWEKLIGYYEYPAFRTHTAYFDPWHRLKMNICKGGLFTYFDWYFRDVYQDKFLIPDGFLQALFDMGLVRYNDER